MDITYDALALEVTRRCNMQCQHCLRGDAQKIDMTDAVIDRALEHVVCIDDLTFTGGEPTLNIHAMRHTLDVCKQKNISVNGFFIATNGTCVSDEFLLFLIDIYSYVEACCGDAGEEGVCELALSLDEFHDDIPDENIARLKALSFYSTVKQRNWGDGVETLIHRGRARNLMDWDTREPYFQDFDIEETDTGFQIQGQALISAKGDLITDCDYDYFNEVNYAIGNVLTQDTPHICAEYLGLDLQDCA